MTPLKYAETSFCTPPADTDAKQFVDACPDDGDDPANTEVAMFSCMSASSRSIKIWLPLIVSVLAVCLSSISLVLLKPFQKTTSILQGNFSFPEVCFPDAMAMHPYAKNLTKKNVNGHRQLCATNENQILALLQMALPMSTDYHAVPSKSTNYAIPKVGGMPPSAHVFLHQHERLSLIGNWHKKSIISSVIDLDYEHLRDVHVNDDSLLLEHTGIYYVYSEISFRSVSSNQTKGNFGSLANNSWFHYVTRMSPNSPVRTGVLLRTVHTLSNSTRLGQGSIFTGGIFHLQQGDLIYASFSEDTVVDFDSRSTFLGLFMITV